MNPTPGSIIANRFQLVRELGRGTMGTVWLAHHLTLDVPCAVKFMTVQAAREAMYTARFALEARAIAQLQSPYIVRVLDYDLWEGVPFIAMERLLGEDLAARLERVKKLDAETTVRIISQVARGLARAHAGGIVHRDLKPENIFLAREGDEETAKIVDFGIAKFDDRAAHKTQVGEVLGTPAYMSPEQARSADTIDARADLWSLGAIAFECLTGRLAFDGTSLADIFARILSEPMPVPSHVDPTLPPEFDAWFARAMAREPEGRFTDAREMAEALEHALGLDDGPRRGRLELVTARTLRPLAPSYPDHSFPDEGAAFLPRRSRMGWSLGLLGLGIGVIAALIPATHLDRRPVREDLEQRIRTAATELVQAPTATPMVEPPPAAASAAALAPPAESAPAPELASAAAPEAAPASASAPESAPAPASASAPAPASAPESASALASATAPSPAPDSSALASASALRTAAVTGPSAPHPAAAHRAAPAPRMGPAAAEAQRGECVAGQRRCSGTMLQVCNATLDGWTDSVDCGETATCDATTSGAGPCVPLPTAPRTAPPAASTPDPNPYDPTGL